MKKLILLLFLGCSSLFVSAQKCSQIDFDEIYKKNNDKKSLFFFSKLLKRYQALDTTMTPEEYKYLYYGYTRSTFYSPIDTEAIILRNLIADNKIKKSKKIIKKLNRTNPLSLNLAYSKIFLAFEEKKEAKTKIYVIQTKGLQSAILASGDGKSEQNAFVITSIEDEYIVMKLLHIEFITKEETKYYDNFKINQSYSVAFLSKKTFGYNERIYFNKEKSSEYLQKMLEGKK